jgi:hypothetical protein
MREHGKHRSTTGPAGWARLRLSAAHRRAALVVASVFAIVSMATAGSYAAWTATDANSGNTFATSTVLLTDNQGGEAGSSSNSGTAMINVTNLSPGSSATTACIGVNLSGAAASGMTLSATLGGAGQATLQSQLDVTAAQYNTTGTVSITPGSNTNSGSCASYPGSGTNTNIGSPSGSTTMATWAAGAPYTIASPVTNTWYKFTVSGLPAGDTSCATYCSQTITLALTWTLTTT